MTTSTFNAITYANKLKKAGMDIKVADVEAEELSNIINNNMLTKEDLLSVKNDLKLLELQLKGFIVKSLITGFVFFGALQTVLHFIKV